MHIAVPSFLETPKHHCMHHAVISHPMYNKRRACVLGYFVVPHPGRVKTASDVGWVWNRVDTWLGLEEGLFRADFF